jgi:hypothetical protein
MLLLIEIYNHTRWQDIFQGLCARLRGEAGTVAESASGWFAIRKLGRLKDCLSDANNACLLATVL